jgi:Skp family chaperone for outer membrane proteins
MQLCILILAVISAQTSLAHKYNSVTEEEVKRAQQLYDDDKAKFEALQKEVKRNQQRYDDDKAKFEALQQRYDDELEKCEALQKELKRNQQLYDDGLAKYEALQKEVKRTRQQYDDDKAEFFFFQGYVLDRRIGFIEEGPSGQPTTRTTQVSRPQLHAAYFRTARKKNTCQLLANPPPIP